ncbi:MAG TPA: ChaN family lipoprotein [Candidatus Polarisedimenticolaceae bacterium]|nr:ChaN family lipoprotein [Candidatus Polarisedimenticolaceae bacterium]
MRIATAGVLLAATAAWAEGLYDMPIGDLGRAQRTVELVLDAVTDCHTGEVIPPGELPRRLDGVRLLFVGERHISAEFHAVELRVLQELVRAGRTVAIGLEMYPYTEQRYLDQWSAGLLTEQGFVELSDWYDNWGYDWQYYREIFLFARDHGLPMHALNTPREVISAVRQKGFDDLTEEEARHVPPAIDTDSDDHLRLFRAMLEEDSDEDFHAELPDEILRPMFDAQCTWDATMAHHAVKALAGGQADEILVVLVGTGHLAYELGLQRQARQWFDGRMATLIPISVGDECEPVHRVRASFADFVWGVPEEPSPARPFLGLSTTADPESGRRKVIYVSTDSPAEAAGFAVGDLVLTLDGVELADQASLKRLTSAKQWGDTARFTVARGGETIGLDLRFRRNRPEPCEGDE